MAVVFAEADPVGAFPKIGDNRFLTPLSKYAMALPIIFLPAMPCDGRMYADQIEGLKDIVAPSVHILAESTFGISAANLLAQTTGDFVLAGTAYGGCLAMEVLARDPERVKGLWLMNCQPGVHPNPGSVRATNHRIRSGEHDGVIREFAERAIPATNEEARAMFIEMARANGPDVFARQSDATLTRSDHWSTLSSCDIPTLLIWGEADCFVTIDVGRRIAALMPHARWEVLEGCGHFPTLERPSESTAIARDWLLRSVIQ